MKEKRYFQCRLFIYRLCFFIYFIDFIVFYFGIISILPYSSFSSVKFALTQSFSPIIN
jgi:hypothetical protein